MPATTRVLLVLTLTLFMLLVVPHSSYAHDGKLDSYGCHYDKDQKSYHCHDGMFMGGSFASKIEMIRLLKQQFLNLGRPWPYDNVAEEDITSPPQPEPQQ